MKLFKKLFTNNYELQKIQDNVAEIFTDISFLPILRGNFVDASLSTSDTIIEHKLGRVATGYLVVDLDANAVIYSSPTANNSPTRQIILRADTSVNVKLYIF